MAAAAVEECVEVGDPPISDWVFPVSAIPFPRNEIRIARFSPPSERCPPISILHTISPFTILCKVQSLTATDQSPIYRLYLSCFHEQKTAIVVSGDVELHLVAMPTKVDRPPCFWCCSAPAGLYDSCMGMLNLRCLAIVFDLDETLIVANTMKSFEDKIEVLSRRIDIESDPLRDKALLKQYAENDNVMENGRLIGVQNEEVHPPSSSGEPVVRPVIRLQDKSIVLTRINPEITTCLEDLRNYLTAKGRKRFEVYVCTMAERDYALEMWRLLDPGSHLINSKQLLDRVVCVKSEVIAECFPRCKLHPRMAMVIDDRMKVWDDKDQPRVHVTANVVPVLCVARNVACNVSTARSEVNCVMHCREFDENLLRKVYELYYENDILNLPSTPDRSSYSEGTNGAEVERKVNGFENLGDERNMQPQSLSIRSSSFDDEVLKTRVPNTDKDFLISALSIGVLTEIGRRCESKVEFKPVTSSSKDLQFSVEVRIRSQSPNLLPQVFFSGEKIGAGAGRTWKEAQHQAADTALRHLANSYVAFVTLNTGTVDRDLGRLSLQNENGFLREHADVDSKESPDKEELPNASTSGESGFTEDSKKLPQIVAEIRERCVTEDLNLVFREQPQTSMVSNGEYYSQAREERFETSKASENRPAQKQSTIFRPPPAVPTKRPKDEASLGHNGVHSSRPFKDGL
ncbi:unnamed protein product [Spirodela intermedia]|uniref:protein-serine/threonine phosphatase n=1 Tax=Spirodela intermedia TaxID=51605 RepID=A0A7I8IBQ4_SPIIN|nr:unnamed protein product [Spirodela intermedia]CAA6655139.1 unnamed protein product [Spirodela intermedia]